MFKPKTIRSGENLGVIDIAIRRPDFRQQPSELTSVHIENTDAVISTGVIGIWNTFNEQFRIKNCSLAAIEYDGTWNMTVDEKYVFYTIGEPYIAYVNNKMELLIQQGQGTPTRLTSGYITSISCVRGWKNIHKTGIDHGFIVAYIKDGLAYYKSYYENEEGIRLWGPETQLEQLGVNLKSIRVNRSNDFRLIFTATSNDNVGTMCITDRCFGGFSVRSEYISGSVFAASASVKHIEDKYLYSDTEFVSGSVHSPNVSGFVDTKVTYISAYNEGLYEINLFTDVELKVTDVHMLRRNLTFTDENNNTLYYTDVVKKQGCLSFNMLPLTDVIGDITIQYKTGKSALCNMAGSDANSFECSFTPTDTTSNIVPTPIIINAYNTDGCTMILEFDNNIMGTEETLIHSFDIHSIEEEYVHGPKFTKYYTPSNVTINDNIITITFDKDKSFNNAQDKIIVDYNMGWGDLVDVNGNRIRTQSTSFTPVNLVHKPNPNNVETITCTIYPVTVATKLIEETEAWGGEQTDIVVGSIYPAEVEIKNIGEIRP